MRETEFKINNVFTDRWSPRAFSDEKILDEELMSLFEAARWAPSAFNNQPWRFLYAMKGNDEWDLFFNLLIDFNKEWAKDASALVLVISRNNFERNDKFNQTHSFEAGAAWQNLNLQAVKQNLITHTVSGFDYEKARTVLDIPKDYNIEAMVIVGKHGDKNSLSEELKEKEIPSDRKKVKEIIFKGKFRKGDL